ncbi:hypothetical protein [Psychroserpens algicola]|uniref:Uncharacterized protein n=1 Tax=Psychroserpens algicola TaxID=1719034 RepID=A0ABT0HC23_9FLAO|nr:hypothetical protein [Psychroserpens algicola]MCK8481752.1 hypothetical protein [Psychroserpens algicola]
MNKTSQILTEISKVTRQIQDDYPELQKYLDETRSTLPKPYNDATMEKELQDYLDGLKAMIKKYKAGH